MAVDLCTNMHSAISMELKAKPSTEQGKTEVWFSLGRYPIHATQYRHFGRPNTVTLHFKSVHSQRSVGLNRIWSEVERVFIFINCVTDRLSYNTECCSLISKVHCILGTNNI